MDAIISIILWLIAKAIWPDKKPRVRKTDGDYILFGEIEDSMKYAKKNKFNPGVTLKEEV